VLILVEFAKLLLVPGDAGNTALWFLPMCFFFVAQTQLMLIRRIEELEAKAKP
jgi:Zn-dependent protease with chaperone function